MDTITRFPQAPQQPSSTLGSVALVGVGPGDPELLTLKALRLMGEAQVVLHDRLISEAIMAEVNPRAERIDVGKRQGHHTLPQDRINQLMVDLALAGRRVLRLKGGDPFIFGRGGEELETLAAHGIPYQVVPGVTAAAGCGAYAGIPLTHRDHAQGVSFVTGHRKDDGDLDLNWANLATSGHTLVFYMGLKNLPLICRRLRQHGMAASTPMALIMDGTRPKQQVLTATLASMPALAACHPTGAPTLMVVGSVVDLHQQLAWFGASLGETPARLAV